MTNIKTYEEIDFSKIKRKIKSKFNKLTDEEKFIEKFMSNSKILNKKHNNNGFLYGKVEINGKYVEYINISINLNEMILYTSLDFTRSTFSKVYKHLREFTNINSKNYKRSKSNHPTIDYEVVHKRSFGGEYCALYMNGIREYHIGYNLDFNDLVSDLLSLNIDKVIEESFGETNSVDEIINNIKDYLIELEDISNDVTYTKKVSDEDIEIVMIYSFDKLSNDSEYIDVEDAGDIYNILKSAKQKISSSYNLKKYSYLFKEALFVKIIIEI